MSDKKLTQDQIDKLIREAASQQNNVETSDNNSVNGVGTVKEFIEKSMNASKEALGVAVSQEITSKCVNDVEKITAKSILNAVEDKPYLGVKIDYVGEVKGFDLLLIKKDDALNLVQKQFAAMNMEFDEETLLMMRDSAASELMNQMMGKSASILSNDYELDVDINTPIIKELSDKDAILEFLENEGTEYIFSSYQLIIDENLTIDILKILELQFANSLSSLLSGEDDNINDDDNESLVSKMEDEEDDDSNDYNNSMVDNLDLGDYTPYSPSPKTKESNNLFGSEHRIDNNEQVEVHPYSLKNISNSAPSQMFDLSIKKLNDVNVELSVELGRTKKTIREIINLGKGSIIELDKLSGEPVDLYANGTLIASGEVVIIKDYFAVKILNILEEESKL